MPCAAACPVLRCPVPCKCPEGWSPTLLYVHPSPPSSPDPRVLPLRWWPIWLYYAVMLALLCPQVVADMAPEALAKARADIAASFQRTAVDHLVQRVDRAVDRARELEPSIQHLVVAGGVAANKVVRADLTEMAGRKSISMVCPPIRLCTDNGIMVAWLGHERLRLGLCEAVPQGRGAQDVERFVEVRPRWPLGPRDDQCAQPWGPGGVSKGRFRGAKRPAEEGTKPQKSKVARVEEAKST